ncbi:hypothetical protein DICVIV_00267 [Dictyocaulus viviparus]|uniref:Uncharacterized protein n=1 Tax=Dictyocaulus viviparus TaxID=29172 RepID=A0A0D8Y9J9_DICVI|nr:hypothetical protein DICVIV_00267 [Dictyocaulus viviparus]
MHIVPKAAQQCKRGLNTHMVCSKLIYILFHLHHTQLERAAQNRNSRFDHTGVFVTLEMDHTFTPHSGIIWTIRNLRSRNTT